MGMEAVTDYKSLELTDNSKVRFKKNHNNTFSLASGLPEHGGTCVHATVGEGGCIGKCYDANLRSLYKAYASKEDRNTSLVWDKDFTEQLKVIENTIAKWRLNGGAKEPFFRIHTGGEFFSLSYTAAWAKAIAMHPDIYFWAYTRSMFAVPILAELKNLTLMLSCDPVNKEKVFAVYEIYKDHPNIALAWMGNTLPGDLPKDRAVLLCPEVTGKIKKLKDKGACARCRACVNRPLKSGKIRHIQFNIHR
jgi:hypothetical protein